MTQASQQYEDDDGRVICSMDVDGMPWHEKRARREQKAAQAAARAAVPQGDQLTQSETLRYTWHAILAGLLVVGVFSLTMVLFVLFCTQIWFK